MTLLGRPVPASAKRAVHALRPGEALRCGDEWQDAFVVVEHGGVELIGPHGGRLRLVEGDVFCLALLCPAVIRADGSGRAVLALVRRPGAREVGRD